MVSGRLSSIQYTSIVVESMTGEEVAREVVDTVSVKYRIFSEQVFVAVRDRVSASTITMQTVKVLYPNMLDVGCFFRTLDIIRDCFNTPVLDDFCYLWISLFSHSFVPGWNV